LALQLGRTRDELRDSVTLAEYADWRSLWAVEPWGGPVEDERTRLLASWMVSAWSKRSFGPRDFDFSWGEQPRHKVSTAEGVRLLAAGIKR
jgi:hypothetical protein